MSGAATPPATPAGQLAPGRRPSVRQPVRAVQRVRTPWSRRVGRAWALTWRMTSRCARLSPRPAASEGCSPYRTVPASTASLCSSITVSSLPCEGDEEGVGVCALRPVAAPAADNGGRGVPAAAGDRCGRVWPSTPASTACWSQATAGGGRAWERNATTSPVESPLRGWGSALKMRAGAAVQAVQGHDRRAEPGKGATRTYQPAAAGAPEAYVCTARCGSC